MCDVFLLVPMDANVGDSPSFCGIDPSVVENQRIRPPLRTIQIPGSADTPHGKALAPRRLNQSESGF